MEGKRVVVSRSTQIAMEAFVPWVQYRLNDLLGIPQEDERRKVLKDVKVELEAWIKDELNGMLGLQQEDEVDLEPVLTPWIEHQLVDLLWLEQKDEGKIVANVASKLDDILSPMIKHQLYHLIVQIRAILMADLLVQPEEIVGMDPVLVSLIKHHLNDVLLGTERQGDMLVSLIKHRLNDVFSGKEQQGGEKVILVSLIKSYLNDVLSGKKQQGGEEVILVSRMKNYLNDVLSGKEQPGGGTVMLVSLIKNYLNDVWSGKEQQGGEEVILVSQMMNYLNDVLSGQEQPGGEKVMLVSLIKNYLNDVLSGKEQQGGEEVILVSRMMNYLNDVLSGKEQPGGDTIMLVSLIKNYLNDVLSGKEQQGGEEVILVSRMMYYLNDVLSGNEQPGGEKVLLVSLIKNYLNDVLSGKKQEEGEEVILVSRMMNYLNDVLSGKEQPGGDTVMLLSLIKNYLNDVLSGKEQQGGEEVILVSRMMNYLNDVLSGNEQPGGEKVMLVSLIKNYLNDVLSGKEQQGGEEVILVSLMKNYLNDVVSGKEQAGDEKYMLVLPIKCHLYNVLSEQGDEKDILVSLIKHQLSIFLGIEQRRGDEELKIAMAVLARAKSTLSPLVKYQLKIERPRIVLETRRGLEGILDQAKAVLQECGDSDETKKAAKREATVWEWVDEFISVSYEIIDVLEESKNIAKVSPSVPFWVKISGRRNRSTPKLKVINTKLESLLKEISTCGYSHANNDCSDKFGSLVSSSHIDESEGFFCREVDINSVLKHLLPGIEEEEEKAVKVMSIVGYGGSGKTTLAKMVFNEPKVAEHFEPRVWVSVSNFFNDKRLAQDLLRSIGKDGVKEGELDSVLFQLLEESFSGKVFLIVFDDVWTEDSDKWIPFTFLFRNGAAGSRILVTARSEKVAVVGADWKYYLKPLSNKHWWLIWRNRLGLSDKNKISKQMVTIGDSIADKCQGWPLVATALAQILLDKNTADEWQCELKKVSDMGNEIWKIRDVALELFRHFHWSYHKLSPALKLCILYCTDFEKGTVIIVDQLVRMWMALGYLGDFCEVDDKLEQNVDDMKTKRGFKYFDILASHSFFQELVKGSIHKGKVTSCKLNDTFHDFIRYEARRDLAALPRKMYSAVLEKRRERHFHIAFHGQVPKHFKCRRWEDVRALVLSSFQLEKVPSEVGELSHVQYLDLSNNPLKELPESICNLDRLEYLDVHRCILLLGLPHQVQKLKQLKHLRVDYTTEELHKNLPKGFEDLTLIRTLDVFRTGGSRYKGAMEKLKRFTDLTDICISVHGEVNFLDADFGSKVHLENLELCFVGEGLDQDKASKIMEDFNPPPNLAMLKFDNYPLMELPKLILEEPLKMKTLTRLSFRSALNIASFPSLWKFPSLEFLWLYDIPKLKHIGREFIGLPDTLQQLHHKTSNFPIDEPDDEEEEDVNYIDDGEEISIQDMNSPEVDKTVVSFPKLKTLRIECMKNLEKWQDVTEDEKKESLVLVMPSLEELIISRCPNLDEKPLCILGDTPWFKRTNPSNPVKNAPPPSQKESCSLPKKKEEKNALPPSQGSCSLQKDEESIGLPGPPMSFDKDSEYMKLRKFVQDTYVTKGLTDHFEVSIPKGVLGNTEVTACLSPKDLYEWFQPHGCVFADQLCIWSKLIYEVMTPADKERVQMVSSALITTVGRKEDHPDTRAEDLVNFMMQNKARLYLVPYLRPRHWELLAIVPESGAVYRFDSLQGNIKTDLTELLKRVERRYLSDAPSSSKSLKSWRIIDIKHKRQTGNWECGYYVMIWMLEVATTDIQSLDLKEHFTFDESPYEPDKLEELKQNWCACYSSIVQKQQV